jgi:hypothetical protein
MILVCLVSAGYQAKVTEEVSAAHDGEFVVKDLGRLSASARTAFLSQLVAFQTERHLVLLINPNALELGRLRERGAVVCHQYNALTDHAIQAGDLIIGDLSFQPPHVVNAQYLASEAKICYRKRFGG